MYSIVFHVMAAACYCRSSLHTANAAGHAWTALIALAFNADKSVGDTATVERISFFFTVRPTDTATRVPQIEKHLFTGFYKADLRATCRMVHDSTVELC